MLTNSVDSFRDTMNSAYIPAVVSNSGAADQQTFVKEFEKSTQSKDTVDFTRENDSEKQNERQVKNDRAEKVETKTEQRTGLEQEIKVTHNKNEDKRVEDRHVEDRQVEDKPSRDQVKNNERNGEEKTAPDDKNQNIKTGRDEAKNSAANLKEGTGNFKLNNIKEVIQTQQIKTTEHLNQTREKVKENFTEAQKIKSNTTAEKVMLKNLESVQDGASTKEKNGKDNVNPDDIKQSDESRTEKRQPNSSDVTDKKDPTSSVKNDVNQAKDKTQIENVFNIGNFTVKNNQPVQTEIKTQKLLLQQQGIREQYEVVKDSVVGTLENSIKLMVSKGENRVSINLHPPELGKIQVELVVKDNHVHARINTENAAVKEVIMTNLDQLKSNIENAGISVTKFDVEVGGFRNQFDHQFSEGNSKGRGGSGNQESGEYSLPNDPDWLPDKIIKQSAFSFFIGRSVNYLV
jgi:flagellar hook-length control protein FliK